MADALSWMVGNSAWNPTTEPSLIGWWKADTLVLNDGDPISSWSDSSASGYTMTAAGVNRPTYKTNQKNSLPAVFFDTSINNQWMTASMPSNNKPHTLALVVMMPTVESHNSTPVGSTSDGDLVLQTFRDATAHWLFGKQNQLNISGIQFTLTNNTWYILIVTYDGSGNWVMLNNGSSVSGTNNQSFTGTGTTVLGRELAGNYLAGYIGEIMKFYSVVTPATIDTYLNTRWAVH